MPENDKPNIVAKDVEATLKQFREFDEYFQKFLDVETVRMEKEFDLNKQVASFYERILLLDVGTLALSITALTSLVTRFPSAHLPRTTFIWIIIPAWLLLLFSTFGCRAIIAGTIVASQTVYVAWTATAMNYNAQRIRIQLIKFSQGISGTIPVDSQVRDVNELFTGYAKGLEENVIKPESPKAKPYSSRRIGVMTVVCMQLGLIMLCVSAVKLLLAL